MRDLIEADLPGAAIVETNAYYEGGRYTTEQHREIIALNGWAFCPVDIMHELGMDNVRYKLIDIDNDDVQITLAEAVRDLKPFAEEE